MKTRKFTSAFLAVLFSISSYSAMARCHDTAIGQVCCTVDTTVGVICELQ